MEDLFSNFGDLLSDYSQHREYIRRATAQAKKFSKAVRFLGAWLESSGGCETDSQKRLWKAKQLWQKLFRNLPRMGLTDKNGAAALLNCSVSQIERLIREGEINSFKLLGTHRRIPYAAIDAYVSRMQFRECLARKATP